MCISHTLPYSQCCLRCWSGKHTLWTTAHSKESKTCEQKTCGKRNQGYSVSFPHHTGKPCLFTHDKPTKEVSITCLKSLSINSDRGLTPRFCKLQLGNLFPPSGLGPSALCLPLGDEDSFYGLIQRKANSSPVTYEKTSQLCLAYLVFGWENADYFKQRFRICFLFFEMEGLILLKNTFFLSRVSLE